MSPQESKKEIWLNFSWICTASLRRIEQIMMKETARRECMVAWNALESGAELAEFLQWCIRWDDAPLRKRLDKMEGLTRRCWSRTVGSEKRMEMFASGRFVNIDGEGHKWCVAIARRLGWTCELALNIPFSACLGHDRRKVINNWRCWEESCSRSLPDRPFSWPAT